MFVEKIRIENFKSIYDPIELNFTEMKGLWKINGDVGSGKTSIGEAIIFGLFGSIKGKNNADLISWGRKHTTLEVWCRSRNKSIYIKREVNLHGQSPIYVEVDGEEVIFTNKRDAQSQLENEYYDISRMTVELLCIISFNNFKSLATLNTADTKKFLDQVLGFYILTQYSDICKEFKSANKQLMTDTNNRIQNLQGQITKLRDIANMAMIEGDLNEVKNNKKIIDNKLKDLSAQYNKDKEGIVQEIENLTSELAKIKALGTNKASEIKFIEQGTCPTCGSPIDQSQLEIKKKEKKLLSSAFTATNYSLGVKKQELAQLTSTYNDEKSKINEELSSVNTLKLKLEEQARRHTINEDEIALLEQQVNTLNEDIEKFMKEDNEWQMLSQFLSNDIRIKILSSFIPTLNKTSLNTHNAFNNHI